MSVCKDNRWEGNYYSGDSIQIEEMPQGCFVSSNIDNKISVVLVASELDAEALIESLQRMIGASHA